MKTPTICITNTEVECAYLWCEEKPTKELKLSYATYSFCDKHYAKFAEKLKRADTK